MERQELLKREYVLRILAATTFIIFFQLYMVAPLIPLLSTYYGVTEQKVGLIVPAYVIPYGISTLFYGLLADKFGPKRIILTSLFIFILLTALTATSQSVTQLIIWRLLTGIGASGVVPIALAWIGQAFSFEERGRPLGWLFGAMAGAGAFGSAFGVILEPFIGWKMLFVGVAAVALIVWSILYQAYQKAAVPSVTQGQLTLSKVFQGYKQLLSSKRGKTAYIFILFNAIFHAGVLTWLGLYFTRIYDLNEFQIGLVLLGYGVPGFLLGPYIGRMADKKGRSKLLPLGLGLSALSSLILATPIPLIFAALTITLLSLGYDLTQPLLAGIITQVGKERPGQAMSLNVFMLFVGFGLGSYLFGLAIKLNLVQALIIFSLFQLTLTILSFKFFRNEKQQLLPQVPVKV
mgnify:CR=1 FL=1